MILSVLENGIIIKKPVNQCEFDYICDVLCVGAGSAGVYAADSAAREGARVILCEIGENIGGMHVCGNVTTYYFGADGGSYEEDDKTSQDDNVFVSNGRHWEQRQIRLTERLDKSGVKLLCRHSAVGLYMEEDRVIGILAYNGSKQISIRAAITIDATSDGHLIRMCDVPKYYGKAHEHSFVPFTVRAQYVEAGMLRSCNDDSGKMDHYDAKEFSKHTILSHGNAAKHFSKGEFVSLALHTGVREGLSFEGEDAVRYEDILFEKRPEKILFWAYSDLDRHGTQRATEEELFQNWWVIANLSTVTASIPVPMGSIVPKGIKGLVTAGRCLSCDTYSQSAVRMNRDMFRMGECVGVAAAMAALGGVDLLDIDYASYLYTVQKRGCFHQNKEKTFGFDNSYKHYLNKMRSLGLEPDPKYDGLALSDFIYEPIEFDARKTFHLLKSDTPGVAIWSCFVAKDKEDIKNKLFEGLKSTDEQYLGNCAIALGLLGDERALPALRRIIKERDCFFFKDNRRSNQFRSAVAVCLLGRIGEPKDLPMLYEILSAQEIEKEMYHTLKSNYLYYSGSDLNFVYYAMFTHACVAICKICKRHGVSTEKLHAFFDDPVQNEVLLRRITNAAVGESAYEEVREFTEYMLRVTV